MAIWEYKVISSGKGGFATPTLLENFLNQLGKDEWEIIQYRPGTDNALAFTGLARRSTQRDWTLEAAAAATAKAQEERRRAEERAEQLAREIEAERRGSGGTARDEPAGDPGKAPSADGEPKRDERLRTLRDTERDDDPDALAEEAAESVELGDWEDLDLDDDLPTLFDALKPHLRRNQRGPGEAAALDYLAKRWDQEPDDVLGALKECGMTVPASEDDAPDYFEFEGDLYWLNCNNRGQLFINVREKPRPRFKPTTLRKLDADDPASEELRAEHEAEQDKKRVAREEQTAREAAREAERVAREAERAARQAAAEAAAAKPGDPLPEGLALFDLFLPKMRRNRRGPGMSGTVAFMAKALKHTEETVLAALAALGLTVTEGENDKPTFVEAGDQVFWLKRDGRGGVWINSRDKDKVRKRPEAAEAADAATTDASAPAADQDGSASAEAEDAADDSDEAGADEAAEDNGGDDDDQPVAVDFAPGPKALPALRLLLKPKSRGVGASAEVGRLASKLGKPAVEILEALVKAGLNVPDTADEKPTFAELGDEILWLNRNAKDDSLWLNAKEKPKRRSGGAPRGRSRSGGGGRKAESTPTSERVRDAGADTGTTTQNEAPASDGGAPVEN